SFTIDPAEMFDVLRSVRGQFFVPLPDRHELISSESRDFQEGASEFEYARSYVTKLLSAPEFTFRVQYLPKKDPPFEHFSKDFYGAKVPDFPTLKGCRGGGRIDKRRYAPCEIGEQGKLVLDREDKFLDDFRQRPPFEFRPVNIVEDQQDSQDFGLTIAR